MAFTYSEITTALDEIRARIASNRSRLASARATVLQAETDLTAMNAAYSQYVTDLNTMVTANPDDAAVQAAKADKDRLVSDFQALKTKATNIKNAIDGVA